MILAHKIRLKRKEKGYSQDYMADQLGITYSKIERGETRLDVDRLKQIVEVFEMDVSDLLDDNIVIAYNGNYGDHGVAIKSY